MSEDKKEFYRRKLHADVTNLGIVNLTLRGLADRWDERKEEIENIMKTLLEFQALLKIEGHMGYHPKVKEIVEVVDSEAIDATAGKIMEAAELAKEVEAKRLAAEKAKAEKAVKKAELEAQIAKLEE